MTDPQPMHAPDGPEGAPLPDLARDARQMTPRERRRRLLLLALLLLLLALLGYVTYYFTQNHRLPTMRPAPIRTAMQPPRFLYAITGTGANALDRPVGVGVADDGRVYVVDYGHRRISVFANNGRFQKSFDTTADGKIVNPVHLVVRGKEVWVSDRRRRQIYVFGLEGTYLRTFTPKNEKLVWTPLAFSFDASGALRVTDVARTDQHRIHFFSADGSRTVTVGRTAQVDKTEELPGTFMFPNGVAVARDGSVYISDGDNRRVQVFRPNGTFKAFVNTSGLPRGLVIDGSERLYVADALAHMVDVYDLKGSKLTQFGSHGFGPGQFNFPNDIALDKAGRIYISDRDNDQIQVWGWPVAEPPAIPLPRKPADFLWCLTPLLLLPLLLLRRKTRIVVTPGFLEALAEAGDLSAAAQRRNLRFVAPVEDREHYEGRTLAGMDLGELVTLEEHSESDAAALVSKHHIGERDAMLLAMAMRARALGTEELQLRWLSALAEVRAIDAAEFAEIYLQERRVESRKQA